MYASASVINRILFSTLHKKLTRVGCSKHICGERKHTEDWPPCKTTLKQHHKSEFIAVILQ